jgi:hypothetical protein
VSQFVNAKAMPFNGRIKYWLSDNPRAAHFSKENDEFGAMRISALDTSMRVVTHELGHAIEYSNPAIARRAAEFRNYRTANSPEVKMSTFGSWFTESETGNPDEFGKVFEPSSAAYVGKKYSSGATEVISMGIESIFNEETALAISDPEYATFLFDTLSGRNLGVKGNKK